MLIYEYVNIDILTDLKERINIDRDIIINDCKKRFAPDREDVTDNKYIGKRVRISYAKSEFHVSKSVVSYPLLPQIGVNTGQYTKQKLYEHRHDDVSIGLQLYL